jgi:2-amino-4-hydroxy-6-hydroxymethyldihydropteridine diphosphokinase
MISEVYLGLGSNLGDRVDNLRRGIVLICDWLGEVEVSSIYETTPVGFTIQPGFFNAACRLRTDANPFELMHTIRKIEATVGRHRTFVNAPRTLDVDILIFGKLVLDTSPVKVPHPRLEERAFALAPLVELAPNLVHPEFGLSMTELLSRLQDEPRRVVAYPRRWFQSRKDGGSMLGMVSSMG